ncbi:hypothetical protein HHI36_007657, partial [Cryptolaemus montrouzieri]
NEETYRVVVRGDFTIDLDRPSSRMKRFCDVMSSYDLTPKILEYIYRMNDYHSRIDNILVNFLSFCIGQVIPELLKVAAPSCGRQNKEMMKRKLRVFSTSKLDGLKCELFNTDWSTMKNCKDPNEAYGKFPTTLRNVVDGICVRREVKECEGKSWVTIGIKTSSKKQYSLYQMKNKAGISTEYYKTYANILKRVVVKAKQMANEKYIQIIDR